MGTGDDRDQVGGRVDADGRDTGGDGGESAWEVLDVPSVEIDVFGSGTCHRAADRVRHHVPGREVAEVVNSGRHRITLDVNESGTFAA